MGYGSKSLNDWRDEALDIAVCHGFTDATVGEDIALIHSELSEALEDHRAGKKPTEVWYEDKEWERETGNKSIWDRMYPPADEDRRPFKPCGIPSEMADVIIRVLHFCGKHKIDIEQAVREKMIYNDSRPMKHGGKTL